MSRQSTSGVGSWYTSLVSRAPSNLLNNVLSQEAGGAEFGSFGITATPKHFCNNECPYYCEAGEPCILFERDPRE